MLFSISNVLANKKDDIQKNSSNGFVKAGRGKQSRIICKYTTEIQAL